MFLKIEKFAFHFRCLKKSYGHFLKLKKKKTENWTENNDNKTLAFLVCVPALKIPNCSGHSTF